MSSTCGRPIVETKPGTPLSMLAVRETVSRLIHDLMKQNLLLSEGKTIYLRKTALDQFRAEV